jgi:HSP20 family protein
MITTYKDPFKDILDTFFENKSFYYRNNKLSDIIRNDEDYRIHLSVPGLSKDNIKISIKDGILSISYEKEETDNKPYSFVNSFKKTYSLPEDCDEKNITGKVENGVVEIVIPKSKKKSIERFISLS